MGCGCRNGYGMTDEGKIMKLHEFVKENNDLFVEIQYNGYSSNHVVPSPTRDLIRKGFANYGMHRRGDKFEVMKTDQQAKPNLFVLIEKPVVKKATRRGRKKKSETVEA